MNMNQIGSGKIIMIFPQQLYNYSVQEPDEYETVGI